MIPARAAQVDAESRPNLIYFLQHGVRAADDAHYVVVIQTDNALLVLYCVCSLSSPACI